MDQIKEKDWLSERLRSLKKRKKDLAAVMNIHPQHINRLLLKIKLTPAQFNALAVFLECDLHMLIRFWDNKMSSNVLFSDHIPPSEQQPERPLCTCNAQDVADILDAIDTWLDKNGQETTTRHKMEIAFAIYESVYRLSQVKKMGETLRLVETYLNEKSA